MAMSTVGTLDDVEIIQQLTKYPELLKPHLEGDNDEFFKSYVKDFNAKSDLEPNFIYVTLCILANYIDAGLEVELILSPFALNFQIQGEGLGQAAKLPFHFTSTNE